MSRSPCFPSGLILMPQPDHFPILTARFTMCLWPRPHHVSSAIEDNRWKADEPQMAKSTTTTFLALLLGGHPWMQCRPLLESLVGRPGLVSASHLHVGAPRLPFTRYKCVLGSPVSATKHTDSTFISSQPWTAGWTRCRIFLLLRTSLSSPRRSPVEIPQQCLREAWQHAVSARVSYWPPSTTKPWTEWECVW